MQNFIKYAAFFFLLFVYACSSTKVPEKTETEVKDIPKKKEEVKVVKETPPSKEIRNNEFEERELIKKFKIVSVEKLKFDYKPGGGLENKGKVSSEKYDDNGFPIENIDYDDKGKVEYRFEYTYNKDGHRTKTIRYNKKGVQDKVYIYEYNKDGNKTGIEKLNVKGDVENYYEFLYDSKGFLLEERWYDKDRKLEFVIKNEYEDDKKVVSYTYDENKKLLAKYEFKYDSMDRLIEEIRYNDKEKPVGIYQYVYKMG